MDGLSPDREADRLFKEFLARWEQDPDADFEAFCDEHPEHADALRLRYSDIEQLHDHVSGLLDELRSPHPQPGPDSHERELFRGGRPIQLRMRGLPGMTAGDRFGDFHLIRLIGEGGLGQVWEARQLTLKRRVALKLLKPGTTLSPHTKKRFRREAEAGARLNHPGLAAVYSYGEEDGLPFIAQELVDGGLNLRAELDEKSLADLSADYYTDVARLFAEIADALQVAHDEQVIHRDIKPQNILLTPERKPKVVDFGLAKVMDQEALSRTGDFAGTYFYMSPEQATAKRIGIDHRTDIFSLGTTLYESLTFVRPFEGDTNHQIAEKILYQDPPDPRTIRSRVPRDLAVICQHAMTKRQESRYQTMADLAADLRRFLDGEPIVARPPGPVARAIKWTRRHPLTAILAGALFVITLLTVNLFEAREEALQGKDLLAQSVYNAKIIGAQAALAAQDRKQARRQLDRCDPDLHGWEWGHLDAYLDTSTGDVAELGSAVQLLAFDPTGRSLVATTYEKDEAILWDRTERRTQDLEGHSASVTCVAFDPARGRVATASSAGDVRVWEPGGDRGRSWEHRTGVVALAFSPDGSRLVLGDLEGRVRMWDLASGESRVLGQHAESVSSLAFSPDGSALLSGGDDDIVVLWDAETGERQRDLARYVSNVRLLACGPQDRVLSLAGGVARVDHLSGRSRVVTTTIFPEPITVDSSEDLSVVAFDRDGGIEVWDTEQDTRRTGAIESGSYVTAIAVAGDGSRVAAGTSDGSIYLFHITADADRLELETPLRGLAAPVTQLAFGDEGRVVAGADEGGRVRTWDLAQIMQPVRVLGPDARIGHVNALTFRRGTPEFLSASGNLFDFSGGRVTVWQADAHEIRGDERTQFVVEYPVVAADVSEDGRAVYGDANGRLYVWETSGDPERWHLHDARITDVSLSPDGSWVASSSMDRTIQVSATGAQDDTWTLYEGPEPAHAVAFDPEGGLLAGSAGNQVLLWSPHRRQEAPRWSRVLESDVTALAFHPGGELLAAATEFDDIVLIDVTDGTPTGRRLEGHVGEVHRLAFDPEGRRLVSGGADGLWLWNTETWEELLILRGHEGHITALDWSADGRTIVSGSTDETIRVWMGGAP